MGSTQRIAAFISIPKNASRSVLATLDIGRLRDLDRTHSPVIFENHQLGRVLARRYDLSTLFVFCFSRDPFDRCISWFQYHQPYKPYCRLTFDQWIREGMPHHFTVQNQTNYKAEELSPLLQYNYVRDTRLDFVGRFEHLHRDWQYVVRQLNHRAVEAGIDRRFNSVPRHINRSRRCDVIDSYYTRETRLIVEQLLWEDFKFFNYPLWSTGELPVRSAKSAPALAGREESVSPRQQRRRFRWWPVGMVHGAASR